MAALIYAKREHIYQVDSVSLMLTSEQWIPLDGLYELPLIDHLQQQGRSFIKPLKYDDMTPEQKTMIDHLLAGERGGANGPFNVLLRSPEVGDLGQQFGGAMRFRTGLPRDVSEVIIIMTGRFFGDIDYSLYTKSEYWLDSPSLVFVKLGIVLLLLAISFVWTEYGLHGRKSWVAIFGTHSLFIYWVHVELVYGQLFMSTDAGNSWRKVRQEFSEVRSLAWMPS